MAGVLANEKRAVWERKKIGIKVTIRIFVIYSVALIFMPYLCNSKSPYILYTISQ